ncbi:MAG: TrmB family transcriptional regulator [Bacillota bacterium]
MDLLEGLQQLGLTVYEARAYLALLARPGATGYELARQSGVPQAKIYEALNGLVAKEAALTSQEGERTLYHPVPHATLLRRHRERAERLAAELAPVLAEVASPEEAAPLITVRGHEPLLERAAEIAAAAVHRLFVSGWPAELERLAPALRAAEQRGVKVYALVYGEAILGLRNSFYHNPPSFDRRLSGSLPALVVVADQAEALLAEMGPDRQAVGLWTRNRGVALIAGEYIRHDIFLAELARRADPAAWRQLNRQMADLQAMWFSDLTDQEGGGR